MKRLFHSSPMDQYGRDNARGGGVLAIASGGALPFF